MDPTAAFSAPTRSWFAASFEAPTPVQAEGWPAIQRGEHTLLLAPTGSGKTLAAFLWGIDRVLALPEDADPGVRVLYISPLKALVYDVERNLRAPLAGITQRSPGLAHVRVAMRTGDTTQRERRQQARHPAHILVTTPESLYLLLTSAARESLKHVDTVIIDEIHAVAGSKRGVHLALSLERLEAYVGRPIQRVGLSATVRPVDSIARFLGGDRQVTVIDTVQPPRLDLSVVVPVRDMEHPVVIDAAPPHPLLGAAPKPRVAPGIWPALYPQILAQIRAHRSTIVFTNSRSLCERLAQKLNELAGEELVRTHHGSVSHEQRATIEDALKRGELAGIVATSSLELGIDMGAVDLVLQIASPGSVARGLQRVGRAGHQVGERSVGRIFPKYRADLLECAVVAEHMRQGVIEATVVPRNCLDVLAQQVVALCAIEDQTVGDIYRLVRRSDPYSGLSRPALEGVLDMLSGRYPSDEFADLRPRLAWDRATDTLSARKGARMLSVLNGGTIADRGLYGVYLGADGPRLGELDEEMVFESRRGDAIILGASTWRVEDITLDRVVVVPAPGEPGRMPFWRGDGPGRPVELGRALGAFVRELGSMDADGARARLIDSCGLDDYAADNLLAYLADQREATGVLPTDRTVVVECFRDEIGDWRVCVLSPLGSRVHAPWALALKRRLVERTGLEITAQYTDDGIALRFADTDELPDLEELLLDPEMIEELVLEEVRHSARFSGVFRESAARALLLPRKRPGKRTPLWAQRRKSEDLLRACSRYPSFPIVLEAYRECLQDVFDLPALVELMRAIERREVRVEMVETSVASPFARGLVFSWVANTLYDYDLPVAERRAQALVLDRAMLRDLLGHVELRSLLDPDAVAQVEDELQALAPDWRARDADEVHDLLRRLGDLSEAEVQERCEGDAVAMLQALANSSRAVGVRVGGQARWIATDDMARYRDGLGTAPPPGVPRAFLQPAERPLESLLLRYARTHGPFVAADPATRLGLLPAVVLSLLEALVERGSLELGAFRPGGQGDEFAHPEVLRRMRRRSLALLRDEVAPVDGVTLARFLVEWQGLDSRRRGLDRLREVVGQLEGVPLSFADLERAILPARVPGYAPRMLDELGALGAVVWVGRGALGTKDGRVALYRREHIERMGPPPLPDASVEEPLHRLLSNHLDRRGASFLTDLLRAGQGATPAEVQAALWDLVWAGLVTNDTFAPLRVLGAARRKGRRRVGGGRWSPVSTLLWDEVAPTVLLHGRVQALLDRYGLVAREMASAESLPGGFAAAYPVLRAMEEAGKVRRGFFVEGLGGAQFAVAGAVDRLRAGRDNASASLRVLCATDPANPWGALVPWPAVRSPRSRPRRVAGAVVVLLGGQPVLFADRGGRTVLSFDGDFALPAAAEALGQHRQLLGRRLLRIVTLDGQPARESALADAFTAGGFVPDHKGLLWVDLGSRA